MKEYIVEKEIKINSDEPCLCGSSLKFKDCCKGMNITRYKKLKVPSKGEEKAIYKSVYHWFKNGFKDINKSL